MNIHFIVAMQAEAAHLIEKFELKKINSASNIDIYYTKINTHEVHLFVNQKMDGMDKIGTVHAALLTYKAIQFLKPDMIFNLGTSGGIHAHGAKIFDIICASNYVIYHDRFSGSDEKSIKQSLGFLPCIDIDILCAGENCTRTQYIKNQLNHSFKPGVIASSNSLIINPKNWEIIDQYNVLCVDMEAAGIAEVAHEFSIPFSALKVVTDNVYEIDPIDTLPQFMQNFHKAMELLSESFFSHFQLSFL